jgi:hypothetical protein
MTLHSSENGATAASDKTYLVSKTEIQDTQPPLPDEQYSPIHFT